MNISRIKINLEHRAVPQFRGRQRSRSWRAAPVHPLAASGAQILPGHFTGTSIWPVLELEKGRALSYGSSIDK